MKYWKTGNIYKLNNRLGIVFHNTFSFLSIEGIQLTDEMHFNRSFCIWDHSKCTALSSCLWTILRVMEQNHYGFEGICQTYTKMMVVQIKRKISLTMSAVSQFTSRNQHCALVKHCIQDALSLAQISGKVHMNKYCLVFTFKKECGVPPLTI